MQISPAFGGTLIGASVAGAIEATRTNVVRVQCRAGRISSAGIPVVMMSWEAASDVSSASETAIRVSILSDDRSGSIHHKGHDGHKGSAVPMASPEISRLSQDSVGPNTSPI